MLLGEGDQLLAAEKHSHLLGECIWKTCDCNIGGKKKQLCWRVLWDKHISPLSLCSPVVVASSYHTTSQKLELRAQQQNCFRRRSQHWDQQLPGVRTAYSQMGDIHPIFLQGHGTEELSNLVFCREQLSWLLLSLIQTYGLSLYIFLYKLHFPFCIEKSYQLNTQIFILPL